MSDSMKPPSEKPTQDPNKTSYAETASRDGELPEVGEQSVILERVPSTKAPILSASTRDRDTRPAVA